MVRPRLELSAIVLDCPDPGALADFYAALLGWSRVEDEPDWVVLGPPGGGARLAFQREEHHVRPVWPAAEGEQQMQLHLDIRVDDLDAAGEHARSLGAELAGFQPQDDVRVHLDPVGHPFCLFR